MLAGKVIFIIVLYLQDLKQYFDKKDLVPIKTFLRFFWSLIWLHLKPQPIRIVVVEYLQPVNSSNILSFESVFLNLKH